VQILYSLRDLLFGWLGRRLPPAEEAPRVAVTTGKRITPRRAAAADVAVALEVRELSVKFGKRVVVDHVNLQVGAQEAVGLIGANGAGKTTLMNAVGGFLRSDGVVILEGRDVSRASPPRRAALGLGRSFQQARLFADLTVRETVQVALESGATKVVVEAIASQDATVGLFLQLGFVAEAILEDHVRDANGGLHDLIVLAHRSADTWSTLATVGLDAPLD